MKSTFNYGNAIAVLPRSAFEKLDKATKKDIKLLFALACEPSLMNDGEKMTDELISLTGLKREEIENSLSFWRGAGVIEIIEEELEVTEPKKADTTALDPKAETKKLRSEDSLPKYTTEELTGLLERRAEYKGLIDECQQIFGKVFNTGEINILVALTDYLGLDSEYILLLFAYCGKMEHKSVRTVEKLAHKFLDEEITDAETLSERLRFMERSAEAEYKIKKIFGITARAFTKKEKVLIEKWLSEYNYDVEIIEKAYELTIDSTQNPSLPYAGAIMDRWHSEGFLTLEQIEKNIEDNKKSKAPKGSSFDTDDFFEAALNRNFKGK
ncbi:MAG: DnaD domain protein [Clostridia bacterium]|nr:DnaD domain protein [Clostridia bacterium]